MNRREILRSAAVASLLGLFAAPVANVEQSTGAPLDVDALLFDPQTPTGGNPKGDVTIVAFFDYNCGYCKKSAPDLQKLVSNDGNIRLVYKEWPILAKSSVQAAQFALAANYQGKYETAYSTLIALPNRSLTEEKMSAALKKAGIDLKRLSADMETHREEITALLKRNNKQAEALQLPGTPVYLIGPYKVAASLDYEAFKDVVADARRRAKEN